MFINLKSTIIYGQPASGKTYFIHQYIQTILNSRQSSQIILIDPKQTELRAFKNTSKTLAYINDNIEENLSKWIKNVTQIRFENLNAKKSNHKLPKVYFIFDELRDAFSKNIQAGFKTLGKLMRYHQELGIELIMSTQREAFPATLTKYADTVIQFSTIVNPIDEKSKQSLLESYLNFENLGLEGNKESITKFIEGYRNVISSNAKVFQLDLIDMTSLIKLEDFCQKRSNRNAKLSKDPLAFAFIHMQAKTKDNLEFYSRLISLVKNAFVSRLMMILIIEAPYKIPQKLKQELHTTITFKNN